jgi:chromosome segregation ATPase
VAPPSEVADRADEAVRADSSGVRAPTLPEPPPTRVTAGEEIAGSFRPPKLDPIPEVPEGGLLNAARYALSFVRARWQRRSAIKALTEDIRTETTSLDSVLGALGKQVRSLGIDNRGLSSENAAIAKRAKAEQDSAELTNREAEENAKFSEVAGDRESKVRDAEDMLEKAEREHGALDAQRRGLRDKRKQIEQRQKSYLKNAEDREGQAGKSQLGDERMNMRRAADDLRRDAAGLDPERQDIERRLAALERPIGQALAKVEALKQELDSAKRGLNDAREGHRHRLAEVEAEQGRKSRELALADAEVQRRLVTLGTLVNLHRIERPEFTELYARVDKLRGAIGAQSTEIDRLTAEREAYDKGSLVRGFAAIGGGVVAVITLIVVLVWIF